MMIDTSRLWSFWRPILWPMPIIVWTLWAVYMGISDQWHVLRETWFMGVTMMLGSFIAGATSEGGGAVAFPVMTLIFHIKPVVARDFSLMIQSVGMVSAAILIIRNRIPIERRAIIWGSLGGALGIVICLQWIAPLLPPMQCKLFFVSLWLSFGGALIWLHRINKTITYTEIQHYSAKTAFILFGFGIVGGMVSGIVGCGLDIVVFSLLILTFRVNEKVGTPTSVVMMATNTVIGLCFRLLTQNPPVSPDTFHYWLAAAPVVVIGAPLGARFIADKSIEFIVGILLASIILQYAGAMLILPITYELALFSFAVFVAGACLFTLMIVLGKKRLLEHGPESQLTEARAG